MGYPFAAVSLDKLFYDDDSDTVLSSTDLESPQVCEINYQHEKE